MEAQATSSTDKQNAWLEKAVDRLWERFENRYGALWMSRWAGLPLARVKSEWADELRRFRPEDIASAFDVTKSDEFPPSLPKFIECCRASMSRSGPSVSALPPPQPLDRDSAAKRASELNLSISRKADPFAPSTDWAKRLRDRYLSGEHLLPIQIDMASSALGEIWRGGVINPEQGSMQ